MLLPNIMYITNQPTHELPYSRTAGAAVSIFCTFVTNIKEHQVHHPSSFLALLRIMDFYIQVWYSILKFKY